MTKKKAETAAAPPELERCAGCDSSAHISKGGHPMVGAMNAEDAEAIGFDASNASQRGFVVVPVCKECHENPEHRVRALKCHFFPRQMAASAKTAAGSTTIG
jgi:hypothetical protein